MSEVSLEWSSPAGPAALALLAGPWRRCETADHEAEVFRMRVPGDGPAPVAADPLPTLARAHARLHAALQRGAGEALPRAEAELLRALTGEGTAAVQGVAADAEVGPWLAELARRATAPARVESTLGGQRCVADPPPARTHARIRGPCEAAFGRGRGRPAMFVVAPR